MIITVASGKGGTGKTTIATSLARSLAETGRSVWYQDCDVEAPNSHLFLSPSFDQSQNVDMRIPLVDEAKCTGCGRCGEICEFHAIVVLGGKPLVFPELCHGCGSCTLECPDAAITEVPKTLGFLERGPAGDGITFAHGLLNIGEPMAVPVINQLKKWMNHNTPGTIIRDSPPGTSCPVVETIRGADFVLLVTEPTPFGLHDLKLAAKLTLELDIPAGVIVNRDGVGDKKIDMYCQEVGIPILMRIPLERKIGEGIAAGKLLTDIHPSYTDQFLQMYTRIEERNTQPESGR